MILDTFAPIWVLAGVLATGTAAASAAPARSAATSQPQAQEQRDPPIWASSFDDAMAKSALQKRLVLLVFLGERCPKCPVIESITLKDPRVQGWMELNVIALRLFDDVELAKRFSVSAVPSILLLDRNGLEIDRITEYMEPPEFVTALVDLKEGRGGLSRARRELEANPDDPQAHLELARVMVLRGRAAEAVEHFFWAFDRMRGDPTLEDERLRKVLGELKVLQRSNNAASQGLKDRRDRAAATLLEGFDPKTPLPELLLCARELVLFNGALGGLNQTMLAWESTRKREGMPPEVVAALFTDMVQSQLLTDRRYQDYLDGLGDPLVKLEAQLAELQAIKVELTLQGKRDIAIQSSGNRISFDAGRYYEALGGVGRPEEAEAVAELLLVMEPTAQAYISLVTAAKRLGQLEKAEAWRQRGLATLKEDGEKVRFERVTRLLLREKQ
jgi:hypothetical protein